MRLVTSASFGNGWKFERGFAGGSKRDELLGVDLGFGFRGVISSLRITSPGHGSVQW